MREACFRSGQVDTRNADLGESQLLRPRFDSRNQLPADDHLPILGTTRSRQTRVWASESDTAAFAKKLAASDLLADAFIELDGDLGAGKTTFIRHLLHALGVEGRIKSPTYAVMEPHQTPDGLAIFHFDFYRFADPDEWDDAGFRDIFATSGLKLAEWPENARTRLPVADLAIKIEAMSDDSRSVTLHARTRRGCALLASVAA